MKVLVIEDAPEIVESIQLCVTIRWPDSTVLSTARGTPGVQMVEAESPDMVMLDLSLPDTDGLDVLKEIRAFSLVPVLIVTARGDETSRVKGLEMGADDYIVKPFSHTELLARMRAVLRRSGMPQLWNSEGVLSGRGLSIDLGTHRVFLNGSEVELTPLEWDLLSYLTRNRGKIVGQQVLAEKVWGSDDIETSAIKMCVRRLRSKLGGAAATSGFIRNHRGRGYSFEMPP